MKTKMQVLSLYWLLFRVFCGLLFSWLVMISARSVLNRHSYSQSFDWWMPGNAAFANEIERGKYFIPADIGSVPGAIWMDFGDDFKKIAAKSDDNRVVATKYEVCYLTNYNGFLYESAVRPDPTPVGYQSFVISNVEQPGMATLRAEKNGPSTFISWAGVGLLAIIPMLVLQSVIFGDIPRHLKPLLKRVFPRRSSI